MELHVPCSYIYAVQKKKKLLQLLGGEKRPTQALSIAKPRHVMLSFMCGELNPPSSRNDITI